MTDINDLMNGNSALDGQAMGVVVATDLTDQIRAGMGASIDDVEASEVVLVNFLIDDSMSITSASDGYTRRDLSPAVREGFNTAIDAISGSKQKDGIMLLTRYLSGKMLTRFVPVEDAPQMDSGNYAASFGSTPLNDQTVVSLATVAAEAERFERAGVPVRSITFVITDGFDNASRKSDGDVRKIVESMEATENHIVCGMGIGAEGDFRDAFARMGIADHRVLTANADPKEIRRLFLLASQSAITASQAASMSKVGLLPTPAQGTVGGF